MERKENPNKITFNNGNNNNGTTNDNWYMPEKNNDVGMIRTAKDIVLGKKETKLKVHDNLFEIKPDKVKINDSGTLSKEKILASSYAGLLNIPADSPISINMNEERGLVETSSLLPTSDFFVRRAVLNPKEEFGISYKIHNAQGEKNKKETNEKEEKKLDDIIVDNNIRYSYDNNNNITRHDMYESYSFLETIANNEIGHAQTTDIEFNKIEIPENASEKTKRQINYKNEQGKKCYNFIKSIEENEKQCSVQKFMFVEKDVYAICRYEGEALEGCPELLVHYRADERGNYTKETTVHLGVNHYALMLFDKQNDIFYIFTKGEKNRIITIDRKTMKTIDKKEIGKRSDEALQAIVVRGTGEQRTFDLIDEKVFDKKLKKYFDEQVEKEQNLNQNNQTVNIITNTAQIEASLGNADKNKSNQK